MSEEKNMNQIVKEQKVEISFFNNGCTTAFDKSGQINELQEDWIVLYFNFLASKGYDPLAINFTFPNGKKAKLVKKTDGGYNWKIE